MNDKYYYAQLGDAGVVVGVSELAGEVSASNMIRIAAYDVSLIGMFWDGTGFVITQP